MNDHLIGVERRTPLHEAAMQDDAAEITLTSNDMQQVAADDVDLQDAAPTPTENYTISVLQVREHLKSKGLTKSKDTVQRWCREGDLDCQKLGVLGRYFTTETSLLTLEKKLLPDMIADGPVARAAVSGNVPAHAAVNGDAVQLHAGA